MGTTLVAALPQPGHWRSSSTSATAAPTILPAKTCTLVTRDHSMVAYMVERGELTQEQAKLHPGKNVITRAVGTEPEVEGDVFICRSCGGRTACSCAPTACPTRWPIRRCSLRSSHGMSKSDCCQRLLHIAKKRGAPDNVTVALAAV